MARQDNVSSYTVRQAELTQMTSTPTKAYLSQGYFIKLLLSAKQMMLSGLLNKPEQQNRIDKIEREIVYLKAQYEKIKNQIQSCQCSPNGRNILEWHYLDGLTMSAISKRLNERTQYLNVIHKEALAAFENMIT